MKKLLFSLLASAGLVGGSPAYADELLHEGFEGVGLPSGWLVANYSAHAAAEAWFRPALSAEPFAANDGSPDSYIATSVFVGATDANGSPAGRIDAILATPEVAMDTETTFAFSTRTVADNAFGDSLRIGAIVAGSFVELATINPTFAPGGYPDAWTTFQVALPAQGDGAFGRYFLEYTVPDASVEGNFIGVDSVSISAVPEPAPAVLMALAGLAFLAQRRRSASSSQASEQRS